MSHASALRIGTRGSALALAQCELVAQALAEQGVHTELVTITTAGDRRAPDTPWGEGAFVRAIEEALLDRRVDAAVHSAKDVPTDEHPRLRIAAYLPRATVFDALVLPAGARGTLDDLPAGTVVGTDSPRRRGFLLARRPDLHVRPLHGNVDTRLRRLDEGEVDALVLAAAGLERLGRGDRITELLPADIIPPAPGQGAIAVQTRVDDASAIAALASIDDRRTRAAVEAERAFLEATGGGCRAPVGAYAMSDGDSMTMLVGFATLDGRAAGLERAEATVSEAPQLGMMLADRIVDRRATLPGAPRVLVTRPHADSRRLAARLAELGMAPVIVPAIDIELLDGGPVHAALASLADFDWVVVTSPNAARALGSARADTDGNRLGAGRWAAVGHATARALVAAGAGDAWLPSQANAATLAAELPIEPGQRVLWLRGALADDALAATLRQRGADVAELNVYRTIEAPAASRALLAGLQTGAPLDAIVFASPSAVRGLLQLAGDDSGRLLSVPTICVGATTSNAAREHGFAVAAEAASQDSGALAGLTATHVMGIAA